MSSPIIDMCNTLDVMINDFDDFLKEILLLRYKDKIKIKDSFPDSIEKTINLVKEHFPIIKYNEKWILKAKKLGRELFKSRKTIIVEEKLIYDIVGAIDGMGLIMEIMESKDYKNEEYEEFDPRESPQLENRNKSILSNRSQWIQKVLDDNRDSVERKKIIDQRNLEYRKTQEYKDTLERRINFWNTHEYSTSEFRKQNSEAAATAMITTKEIDSEISILEGELKDFTCPKCGGKILEKRIFTDDNENDENYSDVKIKYACKACNYFINDKSD